MDMLGLMGLIPELAVPEIMVPAVRQMYQTFSAVAVLILMVQQAYPLVVVLDQVLVTHQQVVLVEISDRY